MGGDIHDEAFSMVVSPQGKIIVAGQSISNGIVESANRDLIILAVDAQGRNQCEKVDKADISEEMPVYTYQFTTASFETLEL